MKDFWAEELQNQRKGKLRKVVILVAILLIIIGIVFVIETLSCIIQIGYYKLTKKRFFKMAPLHHGLEKEGWRENDIVKLFWVIGLIGAMISIAFGVWL